jgi:hypothetical protein
MQIKIEKPNKIIDSEDFFNKTGVTFFTLNGEFYVNGVENKEEAKALIDAYAFVAPPQPTIEDKLASVGLSVTDLKTALGL